MIETAFDRIRKKREKSIKELWETLKAQDLKVTAIKQHICETEGVSLSTVNRILKTLNLPE